MTSAKDKLLELLRQVVVKGEFTLASGKKSSYYINGKDVSLDPVGLSLLSNAFVERLPHKATAVGGMTMGADPIAAGVALRALDKGKRLQAFIVRKEAKGHGLDSLIVGKLTPGSKCVVVEDVVTTGGSSLKAVKILEEEGHRVIKVLSMVDRQDGGAEALAPWNFEALFTPKDLGV